MRSRWQFSPGAGFFAVTCIGAACGGGPRDSFHALTSTGVRQQFLRVYALSIHLEVRYNGERQRKSRKTLTGHNSEALEAVWMVNEISQLVRRTVLSWRSRASGSKQKIRPGLLIVPGPNREALTNCRYRSGMGRLSSS